MPKTPAQKFAEAVPILTLGAGLLALFLDVPNWWVIFVIGWVVLTPLVNILVDDEAEVGAEEGESTHEASTSFDTTESDVDAETDAALATLRERYARGELDEEAFERKVERLLRTETVEDARERVGDAGVAPDSEGREPERELE